MAAIDEDIKLKAVFFETYPEISNVAWRKFEDAGRGRLHPLLLVNYTYAARRLAECPYKQQQNYVNKPFEVLLDDGKIRNVTLSNLTMQQAVQVFNNKGVRGVGEQFAFMQAQKTPKAKRTLRGKRVKETPSFQISRGKLVVNTKCVFTRADLLMIIIKMEKKGSIETAL